MPRRDEDCSPDLVGVASSGRTSKYVGHESVRHGVREYARGDVNTNTIESSFALAKRGIVGIYHNVNKEYLQRYIWQFDFVWNNRVLNDGERTVLAIRASEGRWLMYKDPSAI